MSKKCTPLWREAHFEVKMYKTPQCRTFWQLRCRKSARRCGAKHISKKMYKTPQCRTAFGGSDVEKVHAVVARRHFEVKSAKKLKGTEHFWRGAGFCSISKNAGRRGTFEEDLQRCISRGRHSTKDMFIRDVRRSGR